MACYNTSNTWQEAFSAIFSALRLYVILPIRLLSTNKLLVTTPLEYPVSKRAYIDIPFTFIVIYYKLDETLIIVSLLEIPK